MKDTWNERAPSGREDWKPHRRPAPPAFSPTTYRNVWGATVNDYKDIVDKARLDRNNNVSPLKIGSNTVTIADGSPLTASAEGDYSGSPYKPYPFSPRSLTVL